MLYQLFDTTKEFIKEHNKFVLTISIITLLLLFTQFIINKWNIVQEGFDLIQALICPFRILKNIPKCMSFWIHEWIVFHIIWFIIWLVMYVVIFLPTWCLCKVACIFLSKWGLCYLPKSSDICISKKGFYKGIDLGVQTINGNTFFYRSNRDIDNCYCLKPIEKLFDPLREKVKFKGPTLVGMFKSFYNYLFANIDKVSSKLSDIPYDEFNPEDMKKLDEYNKPSTDLTQDAVATLQTRQRPPLQNR